VDDDPTLLDIMMRDLRLQKGVYRPGPYWRRTAHAAAKEMQRSGIRGFRSQRSGVIGQGYSDGLILDPSLCWKLGSLPRRMLGALLHLRWVKSAVTDEFVRYIASLQRDLEAYRAAFIESSLGTPLRRLCSEKRMPDTLVGGCESFMDLDGAKVSFHYVEALARIWNFGRKVDFGGIRSVFEIGGGFGCNAHLLMHLFPNIRKYVYLDIPPYLYVGTQYLKHFFPAEVKDYRRLRTLEKIAFSPGDEREILMIPPWKIEALDVEVDCFWNSASFQEMTPGIVENYARFVRRLTPPGSSLCLLTYKNADTGRTIPPEKVQDFFKGAFRITRLQPRFRTDPRCDDNYFYGCRV